MADLGELKIPVAMRPAAEAIIALTDQVCPELLDEENAGLARKVVAMLGRRRPSPVQSGRAPTWAGAVVYALGQVNFLFDSATRPYATADDLSAAFGVAKSTLSAKAKQVRDLTKMPATSWPQPCGRLTTPGITSSVTSTCATTVPVRERSRAGSPSVSR